MNIKLHFKKCIIRNSTIQKPFSLDEYFQKNTQCDYILKQVQVFASCYVTHEHVNNISCCDYFTNLQCCTLEIFQYHKKYILKILDYSSVSSLSLGTAPKLLISKSTIIGTKSSHGTDFL